MPSSSRPSNISPCPSEDLYLDYSVISTGKETTEVFAVGVPRKIVDSYLNLAQLSWAWNSVAIETTLGGCSRLFGQDKQSNGASVIIDFGSLSSDISIFDKSILVTGTVQGGGAVFTDPSRPNSASRRPKPTSSKTSTA